MALALGAFANVTLFWGTWAGAILLGLGLAWTTVQIHSAPLKLVVAAIALAEIAVFAWLLHPGGMQWSPWIVLSAGTLATVFGLVYSMSAPGRRKRRIEEVFGGRMSRAMLDKMVESQELFPVAGEKREASVVECQISNYREVAGRLSAGDFVAFCNEFSEAAAQTLLGSGGVLTEGNGEHLRASFGAPLAHPEHAAQAGEAASALEERLKTFGETCRQRWSVEPDCRVSVYSGPVIVGVFGIESLGGFRVVAAEK